MSNTEQNQLSEKAEKPERKESQNLSRNFGSIAPAAFLYAVFYALCMYRNGSGITFPFFVGGSLLFLCFSLSRLGITLKKGSVFYMAAMTLLGISTFCTDDARIIFFNKAGVFLLTMSLLLKQFCDTRKWGLGKYLGSICTLTFASIGELGRPVKDGKVYQKQMMGKGNKNIWHIILGLLVGVPLVAVVLMLLAGADAVFRQMTDSLFAGFQVGNICNVLFRIAVIFFCSYALLSYLCKGGIREEVTDRRKGEPVSAITVTSMLTVLYLLFSVIQIAGLFLGKLQLPEGYTYAMYAREGFFQLLAVSMLNLVIVLVCMGCFRESRALKVILTIMSFCTFIMIASSAVRMIMYIRYYYLTFLRILVLWALMLLAIMFVGVVISIFREGFPLFRYGMTVVSVLYLALSFAHPDYLIARVNVASTSADNGWREEFFLAEDPYEDFFYLSELCADAAPVLIPYLEGEGYHMEAFYEESAVYYARDLGVEAVAYPNSQEGFGYYWMSNMQDAVGDLGVRTFNISRWWARKGF